jgi:phosphoribosylanthranilate isomerase
MVRVKICGVTEETDLRAVAAAGADAVGVITEVPVDTPREITPDRAAALIEAAPPFLSTVLVTMPSSSARAIELAGTVAADAIQMHGGVTPEELQDVRRETGAAVIPALDAADVDRIRTYDGVADAILIDSTSDSGAGGTGEVHDWEATRKLVAELSTPVVLAGGLTADNVAAAARTAAPYAVDVSTGVERTGGRKDHEQVRSFVRNAAGAEVSA